MTQPSWKKAYDAIEQQASPALTKLMSNPDVIDAITLGVAVQRRASQDFRAVIRRGLHGMNLPAGTDVRDVSQQVAGLERQIRQLNRQVTELRAEANRTPETGE